MRKLRCTIWNNGSNGWGIRIGKERNQLDDGTKELSIRLAKNVVTLPLTETFWSTCPEVRSKIIRDYYSEHGIDKTNKNDFWVLLQEKDNRLWDVILKRK